MGENYFNDVEILWISRYDYKQGWRLKTHIHSHYQMIYVIGGSGTGMINEKKENLESHKLMFLPPNAEHSIDSIGHDGLKTLDVKFIVRSRRLEERLLIIPSFFQVVDDEFRDMLERIRIEGDEQDYEFHALSSLYLGTLLIKLIRMQYPRKKRMVPNLNYYYSENLSPLLVRVMAYIENNYEREIKSSDLEQSVNCSYRFLSKKSKVETGLTPMELATLYRITKAKEMLITSDMEIKEISEKLGFSNIHNFTRVFSRITGTPPGKFRRENEEGIGKDILFDKHFVNKINTQF